MCVGSTVGPNIFIKMCLEHCSNFKGINWTSKRRIWRNS
jgi:hypothetical protein